MRPGLITIVDRIVDRHWETYTVTNYDSRTEIRLVEPRLSTIGDKEETLQELREAGFEVREAAGPGRLEVRDTPPTSLEG